ncbi:MAG TPA: hypothetical protein VG738_21600 [Chitinophagaceae bacterium]|nr:hypothetical protein [Chitinophagaceae bacterium]
MTNQHSFPITLEHLSRHYIGTVTPVEVHENKAMPHHFKVDLVDYGAFHLNLTHHDGGWSSPELQNQAFVNDIGRCIEDWYK